MTPTTKETKMKNHKHERYVIMVGDYGVTLYSEDANGQWDATGLNPNGPFASAVEAAEHMRTLPNAQTQIEIVPHLSPAMWLGASADQTPRWWAASRESIDAHLQHVDAYTAAKAKAAA